MKAHERKGGITNDFNQPVPLVGTIGTGTAVCFASNTAVLFWYNRQLINNYAKLAAYMVDIIIALLIFTGAYDTGWTSRYDPFIMDYQLEYHNLEAPCPGCAVAVSDCSRIGDYMLIRPLGTETWVPVIITDCAGADAIGPDGLSWMDRHNIPVELSYELAVLFGAVEGSVEIEVMR